MKDILIYLPQQTVGMSATLIKDLCWVAASHAAQQNDLKANPSEQVRLVSSDGKAVECFSGNQISVDIGLDQVEHADAIFLSAFWGEHRQTLDDNKAVLNWLQQAHTQNIPIAALSNAPFFLGEAGLLNDKVATVYPPLADMFRHCYPAVQLRQERAITDAGNLYCANGIASGCDLIVSIIEMLFGPEVARHMSHDYLLGFNRSYAVDNVGFDGQKYHRDHQILTAQQWLERNYNSDVHLEAVAADIGMSPRNFSRRFKQATGDSPSRYLQRVRLEAAKELLRNSDRTVAEIAYRVGYSDLSYFSRVFNRHEGCPPHIYRKEVELK